MPAKSQSQRIAARIALAAKEGSYPVSKLQGASRHMYQGMSVTQLREYAEPKRKKKP